MAFNRKCYVEFSVPQGSNSAFGVNVKYNAKRIEGVDVKFNIDLPMSAVMVEADVSICNLTKPDIEYLTTFASRMTALNQKKRIRIFAGYEDTETNLIFDGDLFEAKPTQPPDIWLECKALSRIYGSTVQISKSILEPVKIKSIYTEAAKWLGADLDWRATDEKTVQKFDFSGSQTQLLEKLAKLGDVIPFMDGEKLVAVGRENQNTPKEVKVISEESGMIGIPKIDYIGMEAKMFLDSAIKRGDTVRLKSKSIPAANGFYRIYHIRHEGHLRGDEWYTTVKAWRLDTYGRKLANIA
jgi:hypothetical protein